MWRVGWTGLSASLPLSDREEGPATPHVAGDDSRTHERQERARAEEGGREGRRLRWAQSSRSEGMMIEDVLATGETGGEEPLRPRAIIIPGGARERARESTAPAGDVLTYGCVALREMAYRSRIWFAGRWIDAWWVSTDYRD